MSEVLLQWTIQNERGPASVDKGLLVLQAALFYKEKEMNDQTGVLYGIDKKYLKYMHNADYRVSVKNNRPFVGIITTIEGQKYVIPLTSQTTAERQKENKKKRSALITTFITEGSGVEIANLLYNNMIPVYDNIITPISVDPLTDTYISNEIRFIRKSWDNIQKKAAKVYYERYKENSHNYQFLSRSCCDFKMLEKECQKYRIQEEL